MASLGFGPGAPHGTPKPPKARPGGGRKRPMSSLSKLRGMFKGNRGKPKNKSRRRSLVSHLTGKSPFGAGGGMSKPKPKKRSSILSRLTNIKDSLFNRKNKGKR